MAKRKQRGNDNGDVATGVLRVSTVGAMAYDREGARTLPLRLKKAYEALRRCTRTNAMAPITTSSRIGVRVIRSEEIGGPPVSASAVGVGLAVAVAVGLAVAVPPVTVTLPTIPRSSCGMQK
jgi:hypothetical protein